MPQLPAELPAADSHSWRGGQQALPTPMGVTGLPGSILTELQFCSIFLAKITLMNWRMPFGLELE
jgi:hypothetical protein